ncbi:MAG: hypothetical protein CO162_06305 [bacterium (Candidatus Ratteibacteria) CG_4_9_14_3_um_filter_41_21]|uniref:V-type ATP synthase subunit F n=2 Tax=Candidatus Ratteibacteria TaxID=2979319 RepID=A0A2M7YER8_9BACT|nr:MAG: hypothetical protein AUJ76_02280 [Candidatus Omnitrophica bacterium CG1_02_41_171]PIW33866.1 MAG: hypothetical protein COW28_02320 [bacterium (Candidatus Ratteibacteria) CG15_BIG_FIL_POST_REV_8_21_14_020_41_12]PJA61439.1 MAG: hypothetical protein CO162_06305 [bacterium (Candidatus Ratteibacteria) CG_4_9_14_3_um_filter_41_21]
MSNKIAFIGDRSTILPFSALGAKVYPIKKDEDLRGFKPSEFVVVFVTEEVRAEKKDFFDRLGEKIVIIPSLKGKKTSQLERVDAAIRRATGRTE